ncbi:MAG: Uma2 family endonuclease [Bacteroidota bacterium]
MSIEPLAHYSYDTYLQLEQESDEKYEYHDGMITCMAGGTPNHSLIAGNALTSLNLYLRQAQKPCSIYIGDAKIQIKATIRSFYPDLSVICGDPIYGETDPLALINPILTVEVLSDSTVAFDRGEKFFHYRQLSSLKQYVLIDQKSPTVDTFFRKPDGSWEIDIQKGLESVVSLKALGCELELKEVYFRVPGIDPVVSQQ